MHQVKSALHARLLAEDSSGLREPSSSKRQTLPKAEAEVPASHEDIDFVIPAAEKNNPTSLDAAAKRSARARKGWDTRRMTAHLKKEQVELPSLSLKKGRLLILECLMLTACLRILLTVSACTGLFAEIDLGSKEPEGMAMRDWKKLSDEEKAEWKSPAQAKETKRSLSDSAVDEHDVQTLEPDDASSTPLQQRKRKYESHADVAEKEALARKRHYCDLCDKSFATLQVLLQPLVLFHACTCMTQRRP